MAFSLIVALAISLIYDHAFIVHAVREPGYICAVREQRIKPIDCGGWKIRDECGPGCGCADEPIWEPNYNPCWLKRVCRLRKGATTCAEAPPKQVSSTVNHNGGGAKMETYDVMDYENGDAFDEEMLYEEALANLEEAEWQFNVAQRLIRGNKQKRLSAIDATKQTEK